MPDLEYILITGVSGFLGTWIVEAARIAGFGLLGVDICAPKHPEYFSGFSMHPCDRVDFFSLIGKRKIKAVIHLAGGASVPQSVENPMGDFSSLVPGTVALLAYLAKHQPEAHVIFVSSAAVYGNPTALPLTETSAVKPISPYGIHKAAAEFLLQHYARLFGFPASILRVFSAYGEGLRKQVVWDLGQKILDAKQRGDRSVSLHGTGNETRDFVHAADVAQAALLVANATPKPGTTHILNVASGEETPIRTLAELMVREMNANIKAEFNGMNRAGDPTKWRVDTAAISSLGFATSIPLIEGIRRCARWHVNLLSESSTRPMTTSL